MGKLNSEIGKAMKEERLKHGKTLKEVADHFGYNKAAVHYWETGENKISAEVLIEFLHFLDVDVQEFLNRL